MVYYISETCSNPSNFSGFKIFLLSSQKWSHKNVILGAILVHYIWKMSYPEKYLSWCIFLTLKSVKLHNFSPTASSENYQKLNDSIWSASQSSCERMRVESHLSMLSRNNDAAYASVKILCVCGRLQETTDRPSLIFALVTCQIDFSVTYTWNTHYYNWQIL